MTNDYQEFLTAKTQRPTYQGFDVDADRINSQLFLFQRDIVLWSLKLGKSAIFAECGLGKTPMQLEWARHIVEHTGQPVIILAPLAVAQQTVREGIKFGIDVKYVKDADMIGFDSTEMIFITNYQRIHKFDMSIFGGVVLDESSILKSFTGKIKQAIITAFESTPYKLACTATPAPNDHLELGNHAQFLDIMPSNEMISRWFVNDTMKAGGYRLKKHAAIDYWRWLTSWAVCLSRPSDLGEQYDMPGFDLPPLNMQEHFLSANELAYKRANENGRLFPDVSPSATKMHKTKRESLDDRVAEAVKIAKTIPASDSILIWCDTNYESEALVAAFKTYSQSIIDSDSQKAIAIYPTEVTGSDKVEEKERKLGGFALGEFQTLISKPKIAGFGLNYQHCHHMIFVGVSYSFEATYQALRRSYRFGQTHEVNAHIIYAETEGNIISTLHRKQEDFRVMQTAMNDAMNEHGLFRDENKRTLKPAEFEYTTEGDWTMYLGDCVPVTAGLPDNSIDFCVHSPPFSNLYIYSDSDADMGNTADDEEFFKHYRYLIKELYRVTAPGRLCAVHCKDLPAYINRDGYAGLSDFPGAIIQAFQAEGWRYHSRVTIWKDPVIEMQRTKNHGLLHKNFVKESNASRQGMADYMVIFRKWPIDGQEQVKQNRQIGDYIGEQPPTETDIVGWGNRTEQSNYSISVWQRYASPVWFDINQTRVLNYRMAKGNQDEKHICPLQLDVIARSIDLWSNPGDTVLSPFAGIGSEGYEALRMERKFIGIELKRSYYDYAIKHLRQMAQTKNQPTLFDAAVWQSDV